MLATVHVPALTRIELAADEDGLWFAASLETDGPPGSAPLFPGYGRSPTCGRPARGPVRELGRRRGHRAWVNVCVNIASRSAKTETFASPTTAPKVVTDAAGTPVPSDIGEGPFDAAPVLFAGGVGLVAAVPGWLGSGAATTAYEPVVRLDPVTGRSSHLVASEAVRLLDLEANVIFDGSLSGSPLFLSCLSDYPGGP